MLEVLQINLHQCKAACHILSKRLQKVQAYICLIQEPWFFKGQLRGINSVDSQLVYHRGGIRPRAAVFIKGMQCCIVPGFVTRDLVAVQIKIGESGDQKDVVICSAYFPSDSGTPPPPKEFKELVEYCAERKLELLTGCDANAHHTVWGSSDVNSRGEDLCEYLMAQELLVLNKGKAPTFVTRVRQEVLDLTICSLGFQRLVWGWHVSDQPSLWDHRYILYRIDTPHKTPETIRNPRNTEWSKFRNELGDKMN